MLVSYIKNNTYFIAPRHFSLKFSKESPEPIISESLMIYLKKAKDQIEYNLDNWDDFKKFVNPYEYIHTIVYKEKVPVSRFFPVSRSFYKLVEIINYFSILNNYENCKIKSFHLAEGPGGFIEAMAFLRQNQTINKYTNKNDEYWGITLLKNEPGIPNWNKLKDKIRREKIEGVHFFLGKNDKGNLFDIDNFRNCALNHGNSCDILTGDGGFDFSLNFADQEKVAVKLLLVQILYAIIMQKKGGNFIIKFFDMFTNASMELIYILKSFYNTVIVTKPKTSRYANSERYIVCRGFILNSSRIFVSVFENIINEINENEERSLVKILDLNIPFFFRTNLEQANILLGKQQLSTINNTNHLIQAPKNDKIIKMVKSNREKCVKWCEENNIPYNKSRNENVFLKGKTRKHKH